MAGPKTLALVVLLLVSGSCGASAARLLRATPAPVPSPRPMSTTGGTADSVAPGSGDRAAASAQSDGNFVWGARGTVTTAGQQSTQAVVATSAGANINTANPSQPAIVMGGLATAGNMLDSVSATAGSNSYDLTQANSATSDNNLNPALYTHSTGDLNSNGQSFATRGGATVRTAAIAGTSTSLNTGLTGLADNLDGLTSALAVSGGNGNTESP